MLHPDPLKLDDYFGIAWHMMAFDLLLFLFSFTASMVLLCENSLELSAAAIPAISCHDRCWQT